MRPTPELHDTGQAYLKLPNDQVQVSQLQGKIPSTSTEPKPEKKCWTSSEFKKKRDIVNQKLSLPLEIHLQLGTLLMGAALEQCSQPRCCPNLP